MTVATGGPSSRKASTSRSATLCGFPRATTNFAAERPPPNREAVDSREVYVFALDDGSLRAVSISEGEVDS